MCSTDRTPDHPKHPNKNNSCTNKNTKIRYTNTIPNSQTSSPKGSGSAVSSGKTGRLEEPLKPGFIKFRRCGDWGIEGMPETVALMFGSFSGNLHVW